jgi:hypothetical protein
MAYATPHAERLWWKITARTGAYATPVASRASAQRPAKVVGPAARATDGCLPKRRRSQQSGDHG